MPALGSNGQIMLSRTGTQRVLFLCSGVYAGRRNKRQDEYEEATHFCYLDFVNFPKLLKSNVCWEGNKFTRQERRFLMQLLAISSNAATFLILLSLYSAFVSRRYLNTFFCCCLFCLKLCHKFLSSAL